MDRHIATQEMLADTAKWPEEVSQTRPHALGGIRVNFKDVILIVIAHPFLVCVRHRGMLAFDTLIRFVFIREDMTVRVGKTMHVFDQGLGLRGMHDL